MARRPLILKLVALAVLAAAIASGTGALLGVLPVLLLVLPLLRGRYLGEDLIDRARHAMTRRRRWPAAPVVVRRRPFIAPCRTRLVAFACGVRGPPATA
ncbi:hypothetical protein [Paraconexibacter sp. AEG42_29]|uniref:hypothetical protein n=1 Tax=Paraconexibacter sp. AEG42_29 TaxID=2997339 RepID=UPI00339D7A0D